MTDNTVPIFACASFDCSHSVLYDGVVTGRLKMICSKCGYHMVIVHCPELKGVIAIKEEND